MRSNLFKRFVMLQVKNFIKHRKAWHMPEAKDPEREARDRLWKLVEEKSKTDFNQEQPNHLDDSQMTILVRTNTNNGVIYSSELGGYRVGG